MKQLFMLIGVMAVLVLPLKSEQIQLSDPGFLSLEYGMGSASILEDNTKSWTPFICNGFIANVNYPLSGQIRALSGVGIIQANAKTIYYHPQPYVMEQYAHTRTWAMRVPVTLIYEFSPRESGKLSRFGIGAGLYADLVYEATLNLNQHYVSTTNKSKIDFKNELAQPRIGIILNAGFRSAKVSYGLRSWIDVQSFEIQELPDRSFRRYNIEAWIGTHIPLRTRS